MWEMTELGQDHIGRIEAKYTLRTMGRTIKVVLDSGYSYAGNDATPILNSILDGLNASESARQSAIKERCEGEPAWTTGPDTEPDLSDIPEALIYIPTDE